MIIVFFPITKPVASLNETTPLYGKIFVSLTCVTFFSAFAICCVSSTTAAFIPVTEVRMANAAMLLMTIFLFIFKLLYNSRYVATLV
ncbi:Uncharacterised protein [Staphylococcus aureus]|nr:Uncharacterised protein [Staphylococcus aureus]